MAASLVHKLMGVPSHVADEQPPRQGDAADGYIFVPPLTPHGLDEFIDKVVPKLQDRDVFRTEYEHETLRGHPDLPPLRAAVTAS